MLQTKDAYRLKVFVQTKKDKVKRYGRVRSVVFHPTKPIAVGLLVKRPDLALMVKRKDAFVALDKISLTEGGDILVMADDAEAWDGRACKRLGIDFDSCIIWDGMPVRNLDNVELGCISNICIDEATMKIASIDISDGGVNRAILGSSDILVERLRGYDQNTGAIVADIQPEDIELSGGVAGKAGEAWARGSHKVGEAQSAVSERAAENIEQTAYAAGEALGSLRDKVTSKAKESGAGEKTAELSAKAGEAINEGAYKLGKAIGSLKGGETPIEAEVAEVKTVSADTPAEKVAANVIDDTVKKAKAAKAQADHDEDIDVAARAVGAHLKKARGMFGAFKDEFDKASK